jgi:hypothetical protein
VRVYERLRCTVLSKKIHKNPIEMRKIG